MVVVLSLADWSSFGPSAGDVNSRYARARTHTLTAVGRFSLDMGQQQQQQQKNIKNNIKK